MRSPRSVTLAPMRRCAFAHLEVRDRLAGAGDDRLLAGDRHHLIDGRLEDLVVRQRFAQAHVDDDLLDAREPPLGFLRPSSFISAGTISLR